MATEKRVRSGSAKPKSVSMPSELYTVSESAVKTKKDRARALAEFESIVDDNLASSYMKWGKHAVHYSEMDQQTQIRKMKSCNDAYTMSMVMSCASPLGSGVTPGSLIQVWTSYRLITSLNPTMDMDVSRMFSNLTAEVRPMYESIRNSNPMMGLVLRPLVKELDKYGASIAGDKMKSAIRQNINADSLDTMVMTPKQVAALKVSFMEQYYRDLRTGNKPESYYTAHYDTAVEHLKNIAKNSGFDMSVVAAEERHIVGVKMLHNKEYANIFNETYGLYGVVPELSKDGKFSDQFRTKDGHEYNLNEAGSGAFTVRHPINESPQSEMEHVQMMTTTAEQLAAMQLWLRDKNCPAKKGIIGDVKAMVKTTYDEYKAGLEKMMEDDGIQQPDEMLRVFTDQFEQMKDIKNAGAYPAFHVELDRIVYKDILQRTHALEPDPSGTKMESTLQKLLSYEKRDDPIPELGALLQYEHERCAAHGKTSTRSIRKIMDDMRLNYLESLDAEDMMDLLIHAGNNMQQSVREPFRRSYYRDGYMHDPTEDIGEEARKAADEAAIRFAAERAAKSAAAEASAASSAAPAASAAKPVDASESSAPETTTPAATRTAKRAERPSEIKSVSRGIDITVDDMQEEEESLFDV